MYNIYEWIPLYFVAYDLKVKLIHFNILWYNLEEFSVSIGAMDSVYKAIILFITVTPNLFWDKRES